MRTEAIIDFHMTVFPVKESSGELQRMIRSKQGESQVGEEYEKD